MLGEVASPILRRWIQYCYFLLASPLYCMNDKIYNSTIFRYLSIVQAIFLHLFFAPVTLFSSLYYQWVPEEKLMQALAVLHCIFGTTIATVFLEKLTIWANVCNKQFIFDKALTGK